MTIATEQKYAANISIDSVFQLQQQNRLKLRLEPIRKRKERLEKIRLWIHANRLQIHEAMRLDFRKAPAEVDAIELFHVLNEIKLATKELERWTTPIKVDAPLTMMGTRSVIMHEPKGTCLIIAPWNYPFSLAIGPLISALAAGNTALVKPSEMTPHVSALIVSMMKSLFPLEEVAVFEGGVSVSTELLKLPFDHIFFTGSPTVGKVVMQAAAQHLTSVTLELGGKSPCIICADANIGEAAERIVVAKFVNNGQTCIAPDYLLVDSKIADRFQEAIITKTRKFFSKEGNFQESDSYCRIVNDRNFDRLVSLQEDATKKGARVVFEGKHIPSERFYHPVILADIPTDSRIMEEEIFGPILPVVTYNDLNEAISFINLKPKPLALYIFTSSSVLRERMLTETSAGGVCVNDCGIHFLNHNLPFGGVNNSGIGKSHGHYGFLAFSNEKPVLQQKSGFTSVKAFYPPYTATSRRLMDWFLKFF